MDCIPHTYSPGYPEHPDHRETAVDFWSWLETQPLQAWLFYARGANWDNADFIFESMVLHPRCDLAIASWLFWQSEPDFWLGRNESPHAKSRIGLILQRCENGGFPSGFVHYDRVEAAFGALRTAEALRQLDGPPAFDIPRQLIQSFDGSNPPIGPYSPEIEKSLAEIFDDDPGKHSVIWGSFYRSDRDYFDRMRRSGNWWFERSLRLPKYPVPTASKSVVEAIDAVFGEHQSTLQRIKRERSRINLRRHRENDPAWQERRSNIRIALGLLIFAVVAIGGATIAHWLRTGSW